MPPHIDPQSFYLKYGDHRSRKRIKIGPYFLHGAVWAWQNKFPTKQIHPEDSKGEHEEEQQRRESHDACHRVNHHNKLMSDWSNETEYAQ
jgi:hypothetical protein